MSKHGFGGQNNNLHRGGIIESSKSSYASNRTFDRKQMVGPPGIEALTVPPNSYDDASLRRRNRFAPTQEQVLQALATSASESTLQDC